MQQGGGAWNARGIKGFGNPILSNQYTADANRFAEKLKQGSEELALKMEYTPSAVSNRIMVIEEFNFQLRKSIKGGRLVLCSCMVTLWELLWTIGWLGVIL